MGVTLEYCIGSLYADTKRGAFLIYSLDRDILSVYPEDSPAMLAHVSAVAGKPEYAVWT